VQGLCRRGSSRGQAMGLSGAQDVQQQGQAAQHLQQAEQAAAKDSRKLADLVGGEGSGNAEPASAMQVQWVIKSSI